MFVDWSEREKYSKYLPKKLILFGQTKVAHAWQDALFEIAFALYKNRRDAFKKMNARFDFEDIFTARAQPQKCTRNLAADLSNPLIITNKSANDALDNVFKMMRWLRVEPDDIVIDCEPCRQNVTAEKLEALVRHYDDRKRQDKTNDSNRFCMTKMAPQKMLLAHDCSIKSTSSELNVKKYAPVEVPESEWVCVPWNARDFFVFNDYRVMQLTWAGQKYPVQSWEDALFAVLSRIAYDNPSGFLQLVKTQTIAGWFAPKTPYNKMIKPRFLPDIKVWFEAEHTPGESLNMMRYLAKFLGTNLSCLQILCAKTK